MTDKKPAGGPAFPTDPTAIYANMQGMTLRDYFAGQALAGLLPAEHWSPNGERWPSYAKSAYAVADAMLAERDKS